MSSKTDVHVSTTHSKWRCLRHNFDQARIRL